MKKIIVFALCCMHFYCIADNASVNKLAEVNKQWKTEKYPSDIFSSVDAKKQLTFNDWIAAHLMLVEQTLRGRSTKHLSPLQKHNRRYLLDRLNVYWHQGVFPVNDYLSYKNPVFIDRKGTHCAVGYLMQQSGNEALACAVDAVQKFAYISEIKNPILGKWADESGFTLDELAWIQPGYPPTNFKLTSMPQGFNGSVNALIVENNTVYAAGAFTQSTKGIPCNHVASYISGFAGFDWINLGEGLNNNVRALLLHNNKLYAGGDFTMSGSLPANHVAVYDISSGKWEALGSLDGDVYALTVFNNEIYAGGRFTGYAAKWTGSQWQIITEGFIDGEGVRALQVWKEKLYIGGNFMLATGALRKNAAIYDGQHMNISGMGTPTPINDFEVHNNIMYAGCDYISGSDTCALAAYDDVNMDWKTKLNGRFQGFGMFSGTIKQLKSTDGKLIAVGDFMCETGMTFGHHLMEYKETGSTPFTLPLVEIDKPINCIALAADKQYYIGGDFTSNSLNHVAQLDVAVGVSNLSSVSAFVNVYPNPNSTGVLNIEYFDKIGNHAVVEHVEVEMYDVFGQQVLRHCGLDPQSHAPGVAGGCQEIPRQARNDATIHVSGLGKGIYFVHLQSKEGVVVKKIVLE